MSGNANEPIGLDILTKTVRIYNQLKNVRISAEGDYLIEYLRQKGHLNKFDCEAIYPLTTPFKRYTCLMNRLRPKMKYNDKVFWDFTNAIGDPNICNMPELKQEIVEEYRKRKPTDVSIQCSSATTSQPTNRQPIVSAARDSSDLCPLDVPQKAKACEESKKVKLKVDKTFYEPFQPKIVCISENKTYIIFVCEERCLRVFDKRKKRCEKKPMTVPGVVTSLHWIYSNYFIAIGHSLADSYCFDFLDSSDMGRTIVNDKNWKDYLNELRVDTTKWLSVFVSSKHLFFLNADDGSLLTFDASDSPKFDCKLMSESKMPISTLSGFAVSPEGDKDMFCVIWSRDTFIIGEIVCGVFRRQEERTCDFIVTCYFLKHDLLAVCYEFCSRSSIVMAIDLWHFSQDEGTFIRLCKKNLQKLTEISQHTSVTLLYDKQSHALICATDRQCLLMTYNSNEKTLTEVDCQNIGMKNRCEKIKLMKSEDERTAYLVRCYENSDVSLSTITWDS